MIGVDIIKISRISDIVNKFGNKFLKRIFTEYEIEQAVKYRIDRMKIGHFAKRFAAKEAYIKALGGLNKSLTFNQLGIKNNQNGKPSLYLHNRKMSKVAVSLSDDGDYAIAMVMVN